MDGSRKAVKAMVFLEKLQVLQETLLKQEASTAKRIGSRERNGGSLIGGRLL